MQCFLDNSFSIWEFPNTIFHNRLGSLCVKYSIQYVYNTVLVGALKSDANHHVKCYVQLVQVSTIMVPTSVKTPLSLILYDIKYVVPRAALSYP